jgi:solute carrier family 25 citrate transporter 1
MSNQKKERNLAMHLISGGIAGFCEALTCHPLDTIKVRLQLRGKNQPAQSFIRVGIDIVRKESFLALYKGLGAVVTGIVPKMAIRFSSFEFFKEKLNGVPGQNFIGSLC